MAPAFECSGAPIPQKGEIVQIVEIPLSELKEASWNSNRMKEKTLLKLKNSIAKFGVVENLIVRKISDAGYEVLSGNHRLKVLKELGVTHAPCLVLDVDDTRARFLARTINHLHSEDDLGLRAELIKEILKSIPDEEVLSILPETAVSLNSLATIGQIDIADYLNNWNKSQAARLKHMQFQLTVCQEKVVEKALGDLLPIARQNQGESPNVRGTALYLLCKSYLERKCGHEHK